MDDELYGMEAYEAVLSLLEDMTEQELDEVFELVGSFMLCRDSEKKLISRMAKAGVRHRFFRNISSEQIEGLLEKME